MFTKSLTVLALILVSSTADAQYAGVVREGGGSTFSYTPAPLYIPSPPPSGPTFEPASPYPPCAFCGSQLDFNHPAEDLPTREEMNPNTDPVPNGPWSVEGE